MLACGLICISLMNDGVEYLFMHLLAVFIYIFLRKVYSNHLPIFNWIIYPFIIEL